MKKITDYIWLVTLLCAVTVIIKTDGQLLPMQLYSPFLFVVPSIFPRTSSQSPYISRHYNNGYYMPETSQYTPQLPDYYNQYKAPLDVNKPDNSEEDIRVKPLEKARTEPTVTRYQRPQANNENKNNHETKTNSGANLEVQRFTTYKVDTVKSQNPQERQLYNVPISNEYYAERNQQKINDQITFNNNYIRRPELSANSAGIPSQIRPSGSRDPVSTNATIGPNIGGVKQPSGQSRPNVLSEQDDITQYSLAIAEFGMKILRIASSSTANFAISPYSIALILAMVQQGASGSAQQQISQALGISPEVSALGFRRFNDALKARQSRNILNIATNLFVAHTFELEPNFKTTAIQNFGGRASLLDFRNPSDATLKINNWVALHTENKIKDLIRPGTLSAATKLVMANAIYYKGIWKTLFHPNVTISRPFTRTRGDTVMIPFMRLRRTFQSGYDNMHKQQFILLPFEGDQQTLMIILPDVGQTLDKVLLNLKAQRLAQYTRSNVVEMEIEIPKFTIKEDLDLDPVLRNLGVSDIFTPYVSNLKGIGQSNGVGPEISSALHSAMLSIDEQGATAAASTAFAAVALSYDEFETFKADRPFLAVLWDNQLQIPLFLIRVENPTP